MVMIFFSLLNYEFFRERVLFHFLISQSFLFISAQQMFSWLLNLWQDQVYAPVLQFFSFFLIFKKFIFKLQFTFIFFPILQLFYCCSITVVCMSPHPSTPPQPNSLPSLASTLPLGFVHVSFIVVPENPSPQSPSPHL